MVLNWNHADTSCTLIFFFLVVILDACLIDNFFSPTLVFFFSKKKKKKCNPSPHISFSLRATSSSIASEWDELGVEGKSPTGEFHL